MIIDINIVQKNVLIKVGGEINFIFIIKKILKRSVENKKPTISSGRKEVIISVENV